jgi:hypothetical protein
MLEVGRVFDASLLHVKAPNTPARITFSWLEMSTAIDARYAMSTVRSYKMVVQLRDAIVR